MTVNQQMFPYAVEEMGFTRAARRAFVPQQCLSDHIRRLEESYGVRLFDRTPKLQLTEAGELLYQSLLQIQTIETSIHRQLSGSSCEVDGELRLGMHTGRARQLIHRVFPHTTGNTPT